MKILIRVLSGYCVLTWIYSFIEFAFNNIPLSNLDIMTTTIITIIFFIEMFINTFNDRRY